MFLTVMAAALTGCPAVEDDEPDAATQDVEASDSSAGPDTVQGLDESSEQDLATAESLDTAQVSILGGIAVVTDQGGGQWRDIYLLDTLTKEMVPLVVVEGTGAHAANLSWSPDGERLAYFDQGPLGSDGPKIPRLMILTMGEQEPVEVVSYTELGLGDKSGLGFPMWADNGQTLYLKQYSWEPPPSGQFPYSTHETQLVKVDMATGDVESITVLPTDEPVLSMVVKPDSETFTFAAGYTAWGPCEDEAGEWVPPDDGAEEPCPDNRIDLFSLKAPTWEPTLVVTGFVPGEFGTCDGDRLNPLWSWDGDDLAFQVTDCFLEVTDPYGENDYVGLAVKHTFVMHSDGSFSKLTPWKHEHSEDSPTWGPAGSGQMAFIKGSPSDTNMHYNEIAIAGVATGDIIDVTPDGFEHFYEIAWCPE